MLPVEHIFYTVSSFDTPIQYNKMTICALLIIALCRSLNSPILLQLECKVQIISNNAQNWRFLSAILLCKRCKNSKRKSSVNKKTVFSRDSRNEWRKLLASHFYLLTSLWYIVCNLRTIGRIPLLIKELSLEAVESIVKYDHDQYSIKYITSRSNAS